MVLETPPIRRETYGNPYLLPAEGTQLFKMRLPNEAGNGGKDQEEEKPHNGGELPGTTLLVIQRGNVNTDTEYLTISGCGDGAQRFITTCQQQGIEEKGNTFWIPETSVARGKGRGPWREYNTKPRKDWASFTAPGGVKETVLECLDRWDSSKDRQESKGNGTTHGLVFLIHGPPGTGKNTLAEAIASRKDWDIYSIPCGDETLQDQDLLQHGI
ncbi:MAG: hypothetical protein L6R37_008323 [Teloschistes peruensis]|nr:MAG: hypothetical protein L6R37_008323 [Teloschistes peruensis]